MIGLSEEQYAKDLGMSILGMIFKVAAAAGYRAGP